MVVRLKGRPAPEDELEIDVEFDNGDVIHGALGQWFEQAHVTQVQIELKEELCIDISSSWRAAA